MEARFSGLWPAARGPCTQRPQPHHLAVATRPTWGPERDLLASLWLHPHQFLLHLGSPWGPLNRSLTKPDLGLVYGGNEITAPGGTARCARWATRSLVIPVICHRLPPDWGCPYNLMNAFSDEDKPGPCQSNYIYKISLETFEKWAAMEWGCFSFFLFPL